MNPAWRARPTLLTLLVALALAFASLALPTRADAATTHVSISGASSTYSDVAKTLTLTWKVGSKGHKGTVTLQRKSGKTWKKVKSVKTSSKGVAKVKVKPSSTTTYRVRTSSGKTSTSKKLTVHAAYTLTSTAGSTIMAGTSKKFNVYYHHDGKAVKSATVALERKSGSKWVRVSNVKVAKGKGSVTVKPTVTTTYRFHKPGAVISSTHKVTVKPPSSFTITGSGSGHGVGLSQYGAYEMALQGKSYTDILTHYFTGTAVPSVTTPDRIKVQVFGPEAYPNSYAPGRYSDTATSTSVSFTGSWKVGTGEGGMVSSLTGTAAQHLAISVSGSGDKRIIALRLMVGKVATRTVTADSSTAFTISWTSGYATVAGAQGTYNNGTLVVTAIGAQPNVVNDVALNTEYLYGISEMPSSWGTASSGRGLNALEAQAVVARTYALNKAKTLNTKCNCNLVDDVRDQNYTGWKKQNETVGSTDYGQFWVKAVNATTTNSTTARAITSGGTLISSAPYFAASGGHTANNADVWQGASAGPQLSYLHSVSSPDLAAPKNPYAKWTDSISQATAMKIFAYSSTKLANIRSITVSDRYVTDTTKRDGQVRTLTATSDTGVKASVSASPEWWRSTLGVYAAWISSFTPKK